MRNVAIIITKLNGGGAERVASNLSIELSKCFNVTIIVFDGKNRTYPYGGELIDLQLPPKGTLIGKGINLISRVLKIRSIKKNKDIHCAISLMDGPNLVNVFSRRKEKIITSIRIFMSASRNNRFGKSRIPTYFVTKFADKVVALSEAVRQDLIENYNVNPEKIISIYNSCDRDKLLNEIESENNMGFEIPSRGTINYVTMGRLTQQKGQWHLIRAFKKVVSQIPGAMLYIIGEGEYRNKLKTLASDLDIEKSIIFTGFLKNPHKIIQNSDVFVFPSLFEGLGNVLLEALACEMPIISSDCDAGPREILAPDTDVFKKTDKVEYAEYGVLVPVCDSGHLNAKTGLTKEEEILADTMIEFYSDTDLIEKYSKLAKDRSEFFSSKIINEQWLTLVNSITDINSNRRSHDNNQQLN